MKSLREDDSGEEELFEANLINSTVYIIAMSLQVSTFAINYRVSCPFYHVVNNAIFYQRTLIILRSDRASHSWKV